MLPSKVIVEKIPRSERYAITIPDRSVSVGEVIGSVGDLARPPSRTTEGKFAQAIFKTPVTRPLYETYWGPTPVHLRAFLR